VEEVALIRHTTSHYAPVLIACQHKVRLRQFSYEAERDFLFEGLSLPSLDRAASVGGGMAAASGRGTAGAFRWSRTDRAAQVVPPAGATVPRLGLALAIAEAATRPMATAAGPQPGR
jgi:hypothetical protein